MKSTFTKIMATIIIGGLSAASVVPASAQFYTSRTAQGNDGNYNNRDRYVMRFCDQNPRDRDCRDWRDNRRDWSDRRYQQWYNSHYRNNGGDAVAAGIFGLAIGAIVNGAVNNSNVNVNSSASHVSRCEARYRSYDRRSDTYLGFDGNRHACNL